MLKMDVGTGPVKPPPFARWLSRWSTTCWPAEPLSEVLRMDLRQCRLLARTADAGSGNYQIEACEERVVDRSGQRVVAELELGLQTTGR